MARGAAIAARIAAGGVGAVTSIPAGREQREGAMIRIEASSVIEAPLGAVWGVVRDYNNLPGWQPNFAGSVIEAGGEPDRIGSIRVLTLADGGGVIRERLLALSDAEASMTYEIIETPLPIANYRSTIRLRQITDGDRTYITWAGEFDATAERREAMTRLLLDQIYQGGFDELKRQFARRPTG